MSGFVNSSNKSFGGPHLSQNKKRLINSKIPIATGDSWTQFFDFSKTYGGFSPLQPNFQPTSYLGIYNPGIGWMPERHNFNGYLYDAVSLQRNFTPTEITSVSMTYDLTLGIEYGYVLGAAIGVGVDILNGGTNSVKDPTNGVNRTLTWTGSKVVSYLQIFLDIHGDGSPYQGSGLLKSVQVSGVGPNPFKTPPTHQWINYDFTVSNQGFTPYSGYSTYVPGSGWQGVVNGGYVSEIEKSFSSTQFDTYEVFLDWTGNRNGQNGSITFGSASGSFPVQGFLDKWVLHGAATSNNLRVIVGDGGLGGVMTIKKIALRKVL